MEHVTSTDGTRITYDRLGTGPAVVIIGGGPTTRMANAELAERLSTRFCVLNYDRRGRGDSGNTPPFTVDKEYADLAAVLAVAGEPARLVGSSGGAVIALEAAARGLPVARLALWEPSYVVDDSRPPVPKDYREQLERLVAEGRNGDAVAYFFRAAAALPEEFVAPMRTLPFWPAMEQLAPALVHDAQVVGDFRIPVERLAALDVPTLVLDGGTTPWLSHAAQAVADVVPRATRRTLAGQPHNVDPTTLADAVGAFLADENGTVGSCPLTRSWSPGSGPATTPPSPRSSTPGHPPCSGSPGAPYPRRTWPPRWSRTPGWPCSKDSAGSRGGPR